MPSLPRIDGEVLPLILSWPVLACIILLSLFTVYMTFVPHLPTDGGFTLDHWRAIGSPYVLTKVLPNTAIVGVLSVTVALAFGCPLAWLLNRAVVPFRRTLITLMAVSVVVPGFVKAMGWIMLVDQRVGILNKALAAPFGLQTLPIGINNVYGVAWIMGLLLTPTMFFLLSGPMQALDPSLEEAASVVGAGRWQAMLRVSLPLLWPGILGGSLYLFMTALSIFEVPALIGGMGGQVPVLATELFFQIHPPSPTSVEIDYGVAGVFGALIAAPSLIGLYFYRRVLVRARQYEVVTGRGYRPRPIELGKAKYLGLAFALFYLLLGVGLPMLVLVWASLLPNLELPSAAALARISFVNYSKFLPAMGGTVIIRNTLIVVLCTAALVLLVSLMTSWIVVRSRRRLRLAMDGIVLISHAIPGMAFAFGLFVIALLAAKWARWLPLTGTLGIIVFAHLLNRLPYATRITNAALIQIHRDLDESARVCGASGPRTILRVVAPLIKPSLVFAGLWTALLSFSEVTMALFLTESRNKVLAVGVWSLWATGYLTIAAAAAVIIVGLVSVIVFVALAVTGSRLHEHSLVAPPSGSLGATSAESGP